MTESEFVERLFDRVGFDEEASIDELVDARSLLLAVRVLWLGGDPIDGELKLQTLVNEYYRQCSPSERAQVSATLAKLIELLRVSILAQSERKGGNIVGAQFFEEQKERLYLDLPRSWQW